MFVIVVSQSYFILIVFHLEFKQWLICKADYNLDSWKNGQTTSHIIALSKFSWLKNLIFHTSQHIRSSACLLVRYMMKDKTKEKLFIDLLFNYLSEVSFLFILHNYEHLNAPVGPEQGVKYNIMGALSLGAFSIEYIYMYIYTCSKALQR